MIRSDCKWTSNTTYITNKAKARLWFLRRLKSLGASLATLVEIFKLFLRSAVEMAVPLWSGALTCDEINKIERVQKIAVKIILGNSYRNYDEALERLELDTLEERREHICLKFAKRCTRSETFKHWFPRRPRIDTRNEEVFLRPTVKTKRYLISSIPHLVDLLNQDGKCK